MKWITLLTSVTLVLSTSGLASTAKVPLSSVKTGSTENTGPTRYVVELDNLSGLQKRQFASPHEMLYRSLQKRDIQHDVVTEYNTDGIFVGASINLNPGDVEQIAQLSGVKSIRKVVNIPAPKPVGGVKVAKKGDSDLPDAESTHIMTGVNKVHAQGIKGSGIKIGIIDTGIDYTHPYLGGGLGPGFKVIGGYDFVGDAYDGTNEPHPDNDPMDCNGHGTHVGGIIGANPGNDFGISGVAYESSINAYRLFGCTGSVSDDIIIQALLRGYKDGNDILTLSLGGPSGWTSSSSAVVASRIAATGTVVTIAAGNDGAYGSWYASSPGTGENVIAVGSVDNTVIPMQNATLSGVTHDPIPYYSALPLPISGSLEVYATSTDTTIANDACNPLPNSTPDLSNKLVVVRRGACAFTQKLSNIAAKGGKYTFIYNNVDGWISPSVGNYTAVLISPADGAYLVEQFAAGTKVSVSFPQTGAHFDNPNPDGGLISDFSTYGPTYDLFLKPAVSAPGGNILSTYPVALGGWAVESGTSMATPFTAGSAALILQSRGKSVGKYVRDLLQTTASPLGETHNDGALLQTAAVQGAGLIQVSNAVNTKTIVSPGQFLLNDTAHFDAFHTFTIKNTGTKKVTYKLSHVPAGTMSSIQSGTIFPAIGPVPLVSNAASVTIFPSQVTVWPGWELPITATFTPPKGADASTFPVFSGYIQIDAGSETQRVTYMGAVGNVKDKQILDTTDTFFGVTLPALLDASGDVQANTTTYTLANGDAPTILYRFVFGTPHGLIELVPSSFTLPKDIQHSKRGWGCWFCNDSPASSTIKTLGTLADLDLYPRNVDASTQEDNGWNTYTFDGTFANGTQIADGSYRALLRTLRVGGNPKITSDWEGWVSDVFTIKRS